MKQSLFTLLKNRLHHDDGFSLIEIVVAMGVILVSLTMLANTALVGFKGAATARQRQTATGIADQLVEQVRALPFSTVTDGLKDSDLASDSKIVSCSGTYKLHTCSGETIVHSSGASTAPLYPHMATYGPSSTPAYPDTFTSYVWVTYASGDTSVYRLTVKVSWSSGGSTYSVQTSTLLTKAKGTADDDTQTSGGSTAIFYGTGSSSPGNVIVTPNAAVYNGVGVTGIASGTWNTGDTIAQTMYTLDASVTSSQITKVNAQTTLTTPQKKISGTLTSTGGTTTISAADDDPTTTNVTTSSAPTAVTQNGPTLTLSGGGNSIGLNQYTTVQSTIAFRSAASAVTAGGTSVTVTTPSGTTSGDVLLAAIMIDSNGSIPTPSGWTLIRTDAANTTVRLGLFYKVAGSSEPASYTFSGLPTNSYVVSGINAYSGVDTSSPIDVSGSSTGTSATASAPSLTTTQTNTQLVAFWAAQKQVLSTDASMTARWNTFTGTGNGIGENIRMAGAASGVAVATAGATGAKTATVATSTDWVGSAVALRHGSTTAAAGTETAAGVSVTAASAGTPCGSPTQTDGKACAYATQSYSSSNAAFLDTKVDLTGYGLGTCSLYSFSPPSTNPTNLAYGRKQATSGDGKVAENVTRYYGTHTFGSLCGSTGTTPTNWPGYLVKYDAGTSAASSTAQAGVSASSPSTTTAGTIYVWNGNGTTSFSVPTGGTWSTTPTDVDFTTSSNYRYQITSTLGSTATTTTSTTTSGNIVEAKATVGAPVIGTITYKLTDVTNSRVLIDVTMYVDLGSLIAYAKYTSAA
jgi:Tfp pilus assembly protein PilV